MPAWKDVIPDKDRKNLVAYLKSFAADKFKEAPKKAELPKDVSSSDASIKRGGCVFAWRENGSRWNGHRRIRAAVGSLFIETAANDNAISTPGAMSSTASSMCLK